jgi:hypothetical protein
MTLTTHAVSSGRLAWQQARALRRRSPGHSSSSALQRCSDATRLVNIIKQVLIKILHALWTVQSVLLQHTPDAIEAAETVMHMLVR